jgi:IS5 family transposase
LAHLGQVLMDNRHGLMPTTGDKRDGTAEVDAVVQLVDDLGGPQRITLAADKGCNRDGFVQELRKHSVTPHVARKRKDSAIDRRATLYTGYETSIHVCRGVESVFGWMKTWAPVG